MSGPLAIPPARAMPDRVAAVASVHGAGLVRDTDDSPHRGLDRVEAEVYLGWCDPDPTAPPETIPVIATRSRPQASATSSMSSPLRCTGTRRRGPSATTARPRSFTGSVSTRCSAGTCPDRESQDVIRNTGWSGAMRQRSASGDVALTPSKKAPTSHFHRFR